MALSTIVLQNDNNLSHPIKDFKSSTEELSLFEKLNQKVIKTYASLSIPEFLKTMKEESTNFFQSSYDYYQLSIFKSLLDRRLNNALGGVCETILSNNPSHIIIRVRDLDGFGDHFFALKLAEDLKKFVPQVEIAFAFEDQETIDKMRLVNDKYNFHFFLYNKLPEAFIKAKSGLCIGAASFYSNTSDVLDYPIMSLPKDYPYLIVSEYGKGSEVGFFDRHISSGLYKNEFGIFIDKELIEQVEIDKLSGFESILHLAELHDVELRSLIKPENVSFIDYANSTKLFFGYGHKITSHRHFIKLVTHFEKKDNKNVDIILILDESENLKTIFNPPFIKELFDQGIGKVTILTSLQKIDEIVVDKSRPKQLRIICKKFVTHSDFLTMMKMSQPLVMVTGDQSLSEAISCTKRFVYECLVHKINLSFSLREKALEGNCYLAQSFLYESIIPERDFAVLGSWGLDFHWDLTPMDYDKIVEKFLKNPEFETQWEKYLKDLHLCSIRVRLIPYVIMKMAQSLFLPLKVEQEKFDILAKRFFKV
jgi:hypothetical protein